jgi:membrane-associated protease RseP (regulator of RpoE activity)
MTKRNTWRRASLLIVLSVVTAAATARAASGKLGEPAKSFSFLFTPGNETWLGLRVKDTDEAQAKELKLPHVTGVLVVSVIAGSPAARADFQPNDVIMEFDGQRVRSVAQLHRLIEETPADRTVKVEISRKGKLETLQVKIETRGPSASLETPENPKYEFRFGPEFILPRLPELEPFVEPGQNWKIIPLPEVLPKFKIGPIPNPEAPGFPHKRPFVEPWPKGEIIPLPEVMPKFKIGPIPNPEAPEMPDR